MNEFFESIMNRNDLDEIERIVKEFICYVDAEPVYPADELVVVHQSEVDGG